MTSVTNSAAPADIRAEEYPAIGRSIYMNAASAGPIPARAQRAVEAFERMRIEVDRFDVERIADARRRTRAAAAALIGAEPDEIALGPNTSWGIGLAAGFVARRDGPIEGDRVVLSRGEFPANVYPWLALEREGITVERVPADAWGRPREDALLERLDADDVAAFAVSAVQFATGHRADLGRFGRLCRERGILFVVDAIQAAGSVPLDVRRDDIDVLACGGQKWLCSPFGTGFAYVRRELHDVLEPRSPGWQAFAPSADFENLGDCRWDLFPDARRYDQGGTLPFQALAGFAESATMLAETGIDRIWAHIRAVQRPLLDWVRERAAVRLVSDPSDPHRSAIVAIRPPALDTAYRALRRADVACVRREGAIRLAPHVYNTIEEMERVVQVLEEVVEP
ncbi:MAG: aminotransferase class V-fold PLP-dependent enzyme [Gemmatimonadota bacterium]